MRYARAVQKFLLGIKCLWFVSGKSFVTGLYAHKNDFAKSLAYLANFAQHGKGGGQNISLFHAQGSGSGHHGGHFGCGGISRGDRNIRGAQVVRGVSVGRVKTLILLPYHTLNRSGLFLATMRRARYFLSAIKMNRVRSMRSRYWRIQLLRSTILRMDRMPVR